jgi:4-hydroxythreonine-4-phosphate dehydrogenase
MLAAHAFPARLAVLGDPDLLAGRARHISSTVKIRECASADAIQPHTAGTMQVLPVELGGPAIAGRLDAVNSHYVLAMLRSAVDLCMNGTADALVTAPVQKSIIGAAGVPFSGHTEFLAELTGAAQPVMLLVGKSLRIALATTHLPLREVADAIDADKLTALIGVTRTDLRRRFGIEEPRILVLGLNPHAGESGTLGREEQTIIEPVVRELRAQGMRITGPVSADTAFTKESLSECDVVIAMYHDQGLPVLKALSFGEIVNVTLGLPIVRTSVDHGTALSLAGTGRARPDSLYAAVELAISLAQRARVA